MLGRNLELCCGGLKETKWTSKARRAWSICDLHTKDQWETDPGGLRWNTCLHALRLIVSPTSTSPSGPREDGVHSVSVKWPLTGDR